MKSKSEIMDELKEGYCRTFEKFHNAKTYKDRQALLQKLINITNIARIIAYTTHTPSENRKGFDNAKVKFEEWKQECETDDQAVE